MRAVSNCVLALSLCIVLAGIAQAGMMEDSASATLPNDTDVTLYLDKIELGPTCSLDNVYVEVEVRLSNARVQMDNDENFDQEGTARVLNTANSLASSVSLLKTDFDTINNGDMAVNEAHVYSLSATTGDNVGTFNATLGTDYADWQSGLLTAGDSGNIYNGVWNQYVGTGQFSITINSTFLTSATFTGSLGYFEGSTPNAEFYARVVYDYSCVPEPSILTGLLFGLFGLTAASRGRRS